MKKKSKKRGSVGKKRRFVKVQLHGELSDLGTLSGMRLCQKKGKKEKCVKLPGFKMSLGKKKGGIGAGVKKAVLRLVDTTGAAASAAKKVKKAIKAKGKAKGARKAFAKKGIGSKQDRLLRMIAANKKTGHKVACGMARKRTKGWEQALRVTNMTKEKCAKLKKAA